MVFFDQRGSRYLADLELLEQVGALHGAPGLKGPTDKGRAPEQRATSGSVNFTVGGRGQLLWLHSGSYGLTDVLGAEKPQGIKHLRESTRADPREVLRNKLGGKGLRTQVTPSSVHVVGLSVLRLPPLPILFFRRRSRCY